MAPMVVNTHEGKAWMADDFDETPQDIIDAFYGEAQIENLVLVTRDPAIAAYEVRTLAC